MYFVYVDESGTRDPQTTGQRKDGSIFEKDWLYVLIGVSLFEMKWFQFEYIINQKKLSFLQNIKKRDNIILELADTEVKSTQIRITKERQKHKFLSRLTSEELAELVELFLKQPAYHSMKIFAVVIDKRLLHSYMDQEKIHRKAYELLLERVQWFMKMEHDKHRALMVLDDCGLQMNRALAMKHSYFQREGTSSGSRISHIVEMPMFVESSLSNGVQLADLCAYNVYRAFKYGNLDYPYFQTIQEQLYSAPNRSIIEIEGLKVFPDDSPLVNLAKRLGVMRTNGLHK